MNRQLTILIVDDEVINLNILADAFKDHYKLMVTKSGAQGLVRATEHNIDLILLDIMLPDMDGFEVCRRLKSNPKTRGIPVIFITSKTENTDEELGLQVGAVDYIGKPFYLPIVIARVETHLALKHKTDLLESMAMLDGLTNLFNRRKFDEVFNVEYKRAMRDGSTLSVALVDVDHFKLYNDNYGHASGDKVLKQLAGVFAKSDKRACDLIARYGGEEFVIILPNTDEQGAMMYCLSLIELIKLKEIPHHYSPVSPFVTISIGGATFTNDTSWTQVEFFEQVDRTLYQAKKAGRNKLVWHSGPLKNGGF